MNTLAPFDALAQGKSIHDGRLSPKHDVTKGLEAMPKALARLYAGLNRGAAICAVRGEPKDWT